MKFGRVYTATIQVGDPQTGAVKLAGTIIPSVAILYPLTMEFDIVRNTLASANTGRFKFRNLKEATRNQIYHDRYETTIFRHIVIQAGYENESPLPTLFQGNIIQASSYRQGVDWITEIEAFDGGFGMINGQVSQTVPAGWTLPGILKTLLGSMPQVTIGAIGDFTEQNSRGITLLGNPWDLTTRLSLSQNAMAFIDNEQANFIGKNQYIANAGSIPLITSNTGLLQTPRRYNNIIEIQILFEPRLQVGQRVELASLDTTYNGVFAVIGVHHRGTISGAVCESAVTTAQLNLGIEALTAAQAA